MISGWHLHERRAGALKYRKAFSVHQNKAPSGGRALYECKFLPAIGACFAKSLIYKAPLLGTIPASLFRQTH